MSTEKNELDAITNIICKYLKKIQLNPSYSTYFENRKKCLNLWFSCGDWQFSLDVKYSDVEKKYAMKISVRNYAKGSFDFQDLGTFPIEEDKGIELIIFRILQTYKLVPESDSQIMEVDESSVQEASNNRTEVENSSMEEAPTNKNMKEGRSSVKKELVSLHEKVDKILELIKQMVSMQELHALSVKKS